MTRNRLWFALVCLSFFTALLVASPAAAADDPPPPEESGRELAFDPDLLAKGDRIWSAGGTASTCGDGVVEGSEVCDDGNTKNGDCCDSECQFEAPGSACDDGMFCTDADTCNGAGTCMAGPPLSCDDANVCTDDSCDERNDTCINEEDLTNDPSCTTCGDGVVEGLEECDDGNALDGDCCSSSCTLDDAGTTCEDGLFCTINDTCDGAGVCNAGNANTCTDGDVCTDDSCDEENDVCINEEDLTNDPSCTTCGDGVVEGLEQCDDGNELDGDCCSPFCTLDPLDTPCDDGMFCTVGDVCDGAGTCSSGGPLDCDDGDICTDDTCDDAADTCVNTEDPTNDPSCEDQVCGNGILEGLEDCDDGNTEDGDCCSSTCTFEDSGSSCEDGLFCTDGDTCDGAGTCDGGGPTDCDDGDICTDDSCDDDNDVCVNTEDPTNDPTCEDAICGNGVVEGLEECDDGNTADGDCCSSTCTLDPIETPCDDGLFCTVGNVCDGEGTCGEGAPNTCDDGDVCTDDSCDDDADACVNEEDPTNDPTCTTCGDGVVEGLEECDDGNTADGDCCSSTCTFDPVETACDDGLFCTVGNVCDGAGTCGEGAPNTCDDGDVCTDDSCDEDADACVNEEDLTNDPTCTTCGDGVVEGLEECDDGNTADGDCCSASCTFEASGSSCEDGLFCTDGDTCDGAGTCDGGGPTDCNDDDICTDDSCDEADDTCVNEFDTTNDPTCEDEICGNGIVEGLEECDDGNTADGDCCSSTCTLDAAGTTCEDGLFCTIDSTCDGAGTCSEGVPNTCDDGDVCTDDSCDEDANACVNEEDLTNDPTCTTCGDGVVEGLEECDDGNTADGDCCSASCTFEASGSSCEDGLFCTDGDTCDGAGTCDGGGPTDCDDGDICTDDSCDDENDTCVNEEDPTNDPTCEDQECGNGIVEGLEECDDGNTADGDCCSANCTYEAAGSSCEDGEFCTDGDTCDGAGTCDAGGPTDCDDGDICTDDSCDEAGDTCVNEEDPTNDPTCEDEVCGNGILEGLEECDDGNTADGDCCSANCTFEASGSSCEDGEFCTDGDTCDGAGACNAGGPTDCDDGDICTDDSCDEAADACVNEFDNTNDPTCEIDQPLLTSTTTCAFSLGVADVCFDLAQAADDGQSGGPDELTAIDWCITWDDSTLSLSCEDSGGNGIPDAVEFFVPGEFLTFVDCTPEDPSCRMRFSIFDTTLPFALLPSDTLACVMFDVLPDADGNALEAPFGDTSASDVNGASVPLDLETETSFVVDCCPADCNSDDRVDIADAVSIVLEIADEDGVDFCDTQDDVPFDGSPCCDCNNDTRVDIADAVCVVNGIGDLECPPAPGSLNATAQSDASDVLKAEATSPAAGTMLLEQGAASAPAGDPLPSLDLRHRDLGRTLLVPVVFKQGAEDDKFAGPDEITAFATCIDFDSELLELDTTDDDRDGIPDALNLQFPATHSPIVQLDLGRTDCELYLGLLDFVKPSAVLPDGVVAEIEFSYTDTVPPGTILVRSGNPEILSFADVDAVSTEGKFASRVVLRPKFGPAE